MDDFEKLRAELLQDPETRAAYEARRPAYELASKIIKIRSAIGISQRQLAVKAGMTQPEIARLESGAIQPTWETISRVLGALGAGVDIKFRDEHGKLVTMAMIRGERRGRAPRKSAQELIERGTKTHVLNSNNS